MAASTAAAAAETHASNCAGSKGDKPNVLILGGVGFIGRNLVHHLVTLGLTNKIRVVDKVMPKMAWLNAAHKESFSQVEFRHANLINPKSVAVAFETADNEAFDFVVNCAGETKVGLHDTVYKEGIHRLSINCAHEAARHKVSRYIEVSTAQMNAADGAVLTEECKCIAWDKQGKHKLDVEQDLKEVTGLNYVVVRPAIVYGIADRTGLTPRLVIGGIYKYLNEKMKLLWTKDLQMNTVHVSDVVKALWHLCYHGTRGEVYNLADKGNTVQGRIGDLVSEMFDINHDYIGSLVSNMAKLNMSEVAEDVNDKHMKPWGEVCQKDGILTTPLNPYIDQELLENKQVVVDGSKIEQTGFTYEVPEVTLKQLQEVLDDYVTLGLFPASLVKSS